MRPKLTIAGGGRSRGPQRKRIPRSLSRRAERAVSRRKAPGEMIILKSLVHSEWRCAWCCILRSPNSWGSWSLMSNEGRTLLYSSPFIFLLSELYITISDTKLGSSTTLHVIWLSFHPENKYTQYSLKRSKLLRSILCRTLVYTAVGHLT